MMKNYMTALFALTGGIKLVFADPALRRLAMRPWLIGALIYLFLATVALFAFPLLVNRLFSEQGAWWFALAKFGLTLLVVFLLGVISFAITMIVAAVFQTDICRYVFKINGFELPPLPEGVGANTADIFRTAFFETIKLLWVLPALCAVILLSLFPLTAPIGWVIGAWTVGYSFIDTALDGLRLNVFSRLRFAMSHGTSIVMFGLPLLVVYLIPFGAVLILPAAAAGAAVYLAQDSHLKTRFSGRCEKVS